MSDYKKDISPFKDASFLKGSDKKIKAEVSAEDIKEFNSVFGDDDVKAYTPKNKAPAPAAEEDLYSVQSVDIDAFFESLTGKKAAPNKSKSNTGTVKILSDDPADGRTRHFSLNDAFRKKSTGASHSTGEIKNIKKNVRVLVKNKQSDRHILDNMSEVEEKTNVIDVLSTKKGENIFEVVDKAVTKDSTSAAYAAAMESINKSEKIKRDRQALLTGKALRDDLLKQSKSRKLQLIFSLSLFVVSLLISLLPSLYSDGNSLEFLFANGGRLYAILNLISLFSLIGVFYKSYLSGIKSIRALSPNVNCTLVSVTVFILIHTLITMLTGTAGLEGSKSYTCFAVFAAGTACLADFFRIRTALGSLATVMRGKSLQSVQPVDSKKDAAAIAKGISDKDDLNILYSTEVEMGESLTEGIGPRHSEDKFYTYSSAAVIILAAVPAAICYFLTKSTTAMLTAFLSVICFCSPVTVDAACSVLNYFTNYRLNREGAAATDNEAIRLVGKAHGVAMDISDIFTAEVSSFRLVPAAFTKKNTAALYTAAVLINAGALTGKSFSDFVKQSGEELPLTENVQYEERLGFSAWVDGKRVLVGSREMLIQHSIPVPDEATEKHYAMNKFVMYLVIEGRLVASFLVNYKALSSVKRLTDEFNKTGLVLILTSKEPFLGHKEIAKRLSLESAAVRVLSGKSEAIVNGYRNSRPSTLTSGLVCSKAGNGLLSLVVNAYKLYICDRFLFNLHLAGQFVAFVLLLLACLLNMPVFFSPFTIILLELIWSISTYAITLNRAKSF